MNTRKCYEPVESAHLASMLFILCWFIYFSTYIGRLNYSAAMTQMISDGFFAKWQAGMVATVFFACYGIGQIASGFIGDRVSPFKMIFIGIAISALSNIAMGFSVGATVMCVVWGINGFSQSMVWSPITRIFAQLMPLNRRRRACININTTVPAGTIFTYLLVTVLLGVSSWKSAFFVAGACLAGAAASWGVYFTRNKKHFVLSAVAPVPCSAKKPGVSLFPVLAASGIIMILLPTAIHGMLKDGITTWFPTYLMESHGLAPKFSVALTTILPVVNLTGAYLAGFVHTRLRHDDLKTCAVMFALGTASLLAMVLFGGLHIALAIALAAVATSSMFGINTILISILPMYFGKVGLSCT
ncbi:MAG: MFS transporter, partial [Clostridia bacterium]